MNIYMLSGIFIALVVFLSYCGHKIKRANQEIDRLFKENGQLQTEKAVAETQVKNHQVRKQHEENARISDRTSIIERLHAEGDFRDE